MSVSAASAAIADAGGWAVSHSLLSDAMAVLSFEIPGDRLDDLVRELGARGLNTGRPPESVDPLKDIAGRLTLVFSQGTGDLRRDVPAIQ